MTRDRRRSEDEVVVWGTPQPDLAVLLEQPGDVVVFEFEVPRKTVGLACLGDFFDGGRQLRQLLDQSPELDFRESQ